MKGFNYTKIIVYVQTKKFSSVYLTQKHTHPPPFGVYIFDNQIFKVTPRQIDFCRYYNAMN